MQETRRARLQAVILEELASVVAREIKDPRVPAVTFTSVEVTPDGGQATIFVSVLGAIAALAGDYDEKREKESKRQMTECLAGLTSASGFLRRHLASVLTTRHVPTLIFREDKGLANANRVYELLKQVGGSEPEKK